MNMSRKRAKNVTPIALATKMVAWWRFGRNRQKDSQLVMRLRPRYP